MTVLPVILMQGGELLGFNDRVHGISCGIRTKHGRK